MASQEVPRELPDAILKHSAPERLVIVDCLTLWLTNLLMPAQGAVLSAAAWQLQSDAICNALARASGPVLMVSNEIGMGVSPMSGEARRFVDELGRLHQVVAQQCAWVTLMVAGIELPVKRLLP